MRYSDMLNDEIMQIIFEFIQCCGIDFRSCLQLGNCNGDLELNLLDHFSGLKIDSYNLSSREKSSVESRLIFYQGRFRYIATDYRKEKIEHGYDLVISPFDLSRLSKEEKQRLFIKIHHALVEKGHFIYGDTVKASSEKIKAIYTQSETKRILQQPPQRIASGEHGENHLRNRSLLAIDDQMYWMRKSAFKDVDCIWKFFDAAVFVGFK